MYDTHSGSNYLSTPLAILSRPVLVSLQPVLAHTRPDSIQTGLEILEANRSNLIHRGMQQCLAQIAQGAHCCIFGEGGDIGA